MPFIHQYGRDIYNIRLHIWFNLWLVRNTNRKRNDPNQILQNIKKSQHNINIPTSTIQTSHDNKRVGSGRVNETVMQGHGVIERHKHSGRRWGSDNRLLWENACPHTCVVQGTSHKGLAQLAVLGQCIGWCSDLSALLLLLLLRSFFHNTCFSRIPILHACFSLGCGLMRKLLCLLCSDSSIAPETEGVSSCLLKLSHSHLQMFHK